MKFRRLTKEEFEPLAEDFALFLAANSIDKKMWDEMKTHRPAQMEETLDIFSDMVFEKALKSAKYLERITETEIHCYVFHTAQAHLIRVMIENADASFVEGNLGETIQKLLAEQKLELIQGTKKFSAQREIEMFEILKTGAALGDGKMYQSLLALL
jgi:cag pathogenicity island protein 24